MPYGNRSSFSFFLLVFAIGLVGACVEMPLHKNSESEAKGLTLSN